MVVIIHYVAFQIDRYGPHKSKMVVLNICGFIHTELRKKDTFYILSYLFRMLSNFQENWSNCRTVKILSCGLRIIHFIQKKGYLLYFVMSFSNVKQFL